MVKEVALAPARVVEVLRKHRLVTPDADPVEALGRFKNSIEHDVEVNQTIALLPQRDRPQSAYVVIKVRMPDAELGALLARSLGQLVVDTFMHARTSQNEDQDRALALTADELRRDIARRGERLTRAMATPDPALLYRVQIARKEIAAREARLAKVERTRAQGQAALRAEEEGMGTEAVLLDGQIDEVTPPFTRMLMAAIGTLAGAFPVFVILVGAFDPRVYTPADVAHMGLPTLGLVTGLLGKGRAEASGRSPTIPSSAPSPA